MTKILLVEDDKSLREIYGVRLLAEGYDIVSAGDGEEALALAIKDRPALIVSDVMMPKISGFDMLDILRSTTETRDIKVIMMTALSSEDQRLRGQQLGADRYLVKSQVGIEDVVRTVHEVLADAPTSSTDFATPAPQAAAPVASPAPAPVSTPRPAPTMPAERPAAPTPQPFQPQPSLSPTPAPAPQPQAAAPVTPTVAPLPQPTAPFSTPRPTNPSNRTIEPISTEAASTEHVADLMQKELETLDAPAPTVPQQPQVAPESPSPVASTQFQANPVATPLQQSPTDPVVPPVEHGLSFEETQPSPAPQSPPQVTQ